MSLVRSLRCLLPLLWPYTCQGLLGTGRGSFAETEARKPHGRNFSTIPAQTLTAGFVAEEFRPNTTLSQLERHPPAQPHVVILELGREAMREVEHELDSSTLHPSNKLVLTILEFCLLGICGIDRCYTGQICLGLLKGMTVGGLCVWFVVDWLVVLIENFTLSGDLQALGYRTRFSGGIWSAFWVTVSICALVVTSCCYMMFTSKTDGPTSPRIIADFSMFDKEGSGRIAKDQLKKVLLDNDVVIADSEVDALFRELDVERRGTISVVDLQRAFSKK